MSCWCAPHSRGTRSWRGSPRSTAAPGTTPSSPMGACWSGTCATHRPIPPGGRPRSPRRGARGGRLAVDDPTTSAASARWSSTSTASRSAAGGPRGAPRVRRGPDTACLCAESRAQTHRTGRPAIVAHAAMWRGDTHSQALDTRGWCLYEALLHEYPLRVGRRGPHFSGPSAGATLRG